MVENQQQLQMQVRLPDEVKLTLAPTEVITIMGALQEYGPYKVILPIIRKIEQQLLSQQLKPDYKGPPPGDPSLADLNAAAERERQVEHIPV